MTTRCMFCRQEGALSHLHRYYPLEAQWRNDTLARWAAAGATIAFLDPGAKLPSGFVVYVTAQGHYVARNAWQARDALQKQCVKWACTAAAVPPWFKSMVAVCKQ